jgi:UDP-N-acetylglucosamine acyltransferase
MPFPSSCRIHPSAIIAPEVELGDNVEIGALAVIEGRVKIGDDCVIRPGAMLCGTLTMGCNNIVYTGAVLGERPQHLKYNNEPTLLEIGDGNIFREHVTIHRGTTCTMKTVIGNDNFFMANSHVAHDCVVGDRCILANGALVGGHCVIDDCVILSGNTAVHQFVRIGRLAMISGCSATGKDIPPFVIQSGLDNVAGVNIIGMKRAGMNSKQINAVRAAFKMLFREGLVLPAAMAKMENDLGAFDVIQELLSFLRGCTKGINFMRNRFHEDLAA